MRIRLPYGKSCVVVDLRDDLNVHVVEPRHQAGLPDQAGAVRDALRRPIASSPLKEQVRSSDAIGIVVNDITRPTPYKIILPVLLAELNHVPDDRITILVATGTHRQNTAAELRMMLGDNVVDRFRIVQNDVNDPSAYASAGRTDGGCEAWLHKEYLACDLRILTGFIEPHFFAGFSGGGKACMPGLASLETILNNHSPDNIDHPKATWGVTDGNPVWEQIQEVARAVQPTFLLNVALNQAGWITGIFAGDLMQAHKLGCEFVKQHAAIAVDAPYDIVITSNAGHPLDLNLYQAVKAMSAAARIVRDGGAIIVAADCWDGIPDHGGYGRLLWQADSPAALLKHIRSAPPSDPDTWQAQIHASICCRADVHLYSHNLTDGQIARAMLTPCRDIVRTLDRLLQVYGPRASVCVMPMGPRAIPYVSPPT